MVIAFTTLVPVLSTTRRVQCRVHDSLRPKAVPTPARRHASFRMDAGTPPPTGGIKPPLPVPAPPPKAALIDPPPAAFQASAQLGAAKAGNSSTAIFVLGFAAGAYLALGGLLALSVGGSSPALLMANPGLSKYVFAAIGLPIGLTLVVTTGAELFLGNCMLLTAAALTGKVRWTRVYFHWALTWMANFIGALSVLSMVLAAKAVSPGAGAAAAALAVAKTSQPFAVIFMRGVLCNWLVCVGVYLATASRDFCGKLLAVFCAVSTFVTLGLDNCVANMFFLPLGMKFGADITWKKSIVANLIPATLGNLVGGAVLVGLLYFLGFGRGKKAPASSSVPPPKVAAELKQA